MVRGGLALCSLLLLALGVAACASDPPPHAPGAGSREYFPLEKGGHWSYELSTGPFSATTRMEVKSRGPHAVRDSNEALFLMEEQLSGRVYGLEPGGLVGYRIANGYLTRIPAVSLGDDGRVSIFGGDAMSFLPVDPNPGQTWSDRSEVFRESGGARQVWTAEVAAVGSMRVPAGRFDDVIVVRSQQWDPEWDSNRPLHSYEDYYARGVGLIRSVSHNNAQWWWMAVEQELVAVRFDEVERE
ncbi:MAG: hypothetical protein WEF50_14250 [Myxococcota bacterium]